MPPQGPHRGGACGRHSRRRTAAEEAIDGARNLIKQADDKRGCPKMRLSRSPPVKNLRAFCVAARHLSFKFAADELCLTPSAVSHQMRELETMLGVRLFD